MGNESVTWWDLVITEIAANVAKENDDEYFIIRNSTCHDIDLTGISVRDAALKTYVLTWILVSHTSRTIGYAESRIQLNNTNETLTILSTSGATIDEKQYTKTTKWVPLVYSASDQECTVVVEATWSATGDIILVSNSGSALSWETSTWTEMISSGPTSSGSVMSSWDTSWATSAGVVDLTSSWSDTSLSWSIVSSGSTDASGSGETSSGDITLTVSSTTETWSWTNLLTGSISENTSIGGTTSSWEIISSTGTIQSTGMTFTGELTPIFLSIEDTDTNSVYDTVKIAYNEDLTGTVDISSLLVFSATWGLFSDHKFEGTWAFVSSEIAGNILTLRLLRDGPIDTLWKVNSTTSSHFRIKGSTKNLQGLTSHRIARDLTYTTILGGYHRDMISVQSLVSSTVTPTVNTTTQTPPETQSLSTNVATDAQAPIFSLHLQYPSNATMSGDTIICTQFTCRTNFEILITSWSLKSCTFTLNGVVIAESCNPPSLTLDQVMSYAIDISATAKTGEIYNRHLLWSYTPQMVLTSTKTTSSSSSSSQSSCFVSDGREFLQIAWVNPSPKDDKRSSEYVLITNNTNTPISLCGCHLERTDEKWKTTLSKDLEAIVMPWISYQLTTSESKLTLPKVGAKIDLVCDVKTIDSLHYRGNHVDGRLITQEMIEAEDRIRDLLQGYLLTWSIDTIADDTQESSSWVMDLSSVSDIEEWTSDEHFLDLNPLLLWSLSNSTIASDLSEWDDGSIGCSTNNSWCSVTAEIIGLGSHMMVRWIVDDLDITNGSGAVWMKRQNYTFELSPGVHHIQTMFMSDESDSTLFEPINSLIHVVRTPIVSRKLAPLPRPKKAKKIAQPKAQKIAWNEANSSVINSDIRTELTNEEQAAWASILFSFGALGGYYIRRKVLMMYF